MKAITFTLELVQPMLATGLEGDPNAGVSLNYVPGSVIRGAIIGLYLNRNRKRELELNDAERKLFFADTVCYLNAYPLVDSEAVTKKFYQRSLPVLLSWQKEKDTKEEATKELKDFCFAEPEANYKNLDSQFFVFADESTVLPVKVKTRLAVHTRRNPIKGRADSEDGAVFRYESIASGTKFAGAIISENESLLENIHKLLNGAELTIGGSRTGGYGRARVIEMSDAPKAWEELPVRTVEEIKAGQQFTVTLLSNALLRDEDGQFQADLAEAFKDVAETVADKTFKRPEIIGGFNRKWGLPLPQAVSLKAGSVFTLTARQQIGADLVQKWLDEGIGERRLDGFGRVAVNLNQAKHPTLSFGELEKDKPPSVHLQISSQNGIGRTIIERVLRQRLEARLVAQVGSHHIEPVPRNSQISRLRLVLREVLRGEKPEKAVNNFFDNLKKTARQQFESSRVYANGSFKGKLNHWVMTTKAERTLFVETPVALGNEQGRVEAKSDDCQLEYCLRLIDGVLARAAKETQ